MLSLEDLLKWKEDIHEQIIKHFAPDEDSDLFWDMLSLDISNLTGSFWRYDLENKILHNTNDPYFVCYSTMEFCDVDDRDLKIIKTKEYTAIVDFKHLYITVLSNKKEYNKKYEFKAQKLGGMPEWKIYD